MHVQANEAVTGQKNMAGLLKLLPDVPVEIALSSTDGTNVVSPLGTPAVRYTLVDGRTFFATRYVAAKLKKLKVEPYERIALCMRNIEGKSITLVERLPSSEPKQDTSAKREANDGVDPPASDPTPLHPKVDDTCPAPKASDGTSQEEAAGTTQPELLRELTLTTPNGSASSQAITQLERALKVSILASHSAEQYGKEIGYPIRFDQESVKCMAVTVLIGMQGGRN